jgi:hypothetical protein
VNGLCVRAAGAEDIVRSRRLMGASGRPLNVTVRRTMLLKVFLPRGPSLTSVSVVTAATTLVAGCTMGWVRPSTTAEQTHSDYAECEISAAGKYPPNIIKAGSLRVGEPSIDSDANQLLRDEETKFCMRQRGYVYGRVP